MPSKISSIRLISVALVICSIFFISSYLIRIDQQNTLELELDAQKAKETILEFHEQERVKSIQLENQRQLQIEQNKTIQEPGNMNMHIKKVILALNTHDLIYSHY
jgi:biopolymer transport protein ExbD